MDISMAETQDPKYPHILLLLLQHMSHPKSSCNERYPEPMICGVWVVWFWSLSLGLLKAVLKSTNSLKPEATLLSSNQVSTRIIFSQSRVTKVGFHRHLSTSASPNGLILYTRMKNVVSLFTMFWTVLWKICSLLNLRNVFARSYSWKSWVCSWRQQREICGMRCIQCQCSRKSEQPPNSVWLGCPRLKSNKDDLTAIRTVHQIQTRISKRRIRIIQEILYAAIFLQRLGQLNVEEHCWYPGSQESLHTPPLLIFGLPHTDYCWSAIVTEIAYLNITA